MCVYIYIDSYLQVDRERETEREREYSEIVELKDLLP